MRRTWSGIKRVIAPKHSVIRNRKIIPDTKFQTAYHQEYEARSQKIAELRVDGAIYQIQIFQAFQVRIHLLKQHQNTHQSDHSIN